MRENTEKCAEIKIHHYFKVPIEREVTRIDKNGEEITKNLSSILQFVDRTKFTAS